MLALVLLVIFAMPACTSKTPDQEIIESHVLAMAEALEEKNTRRFAGYLAEDFNAVTYNPRSQSGAGLDRNGARLLLRREAVARDNIRVRLSAIEVNLRGGARAVADFRALMTGGSGMIPDEGQWYAVSTGWRRDGGEWKMISAEWEPALSR